MDQRIKKFSPKWLNFAKSVKRIETVPERCNIQSAHPLTLFAHFKTNTKSMDLYRALRCVQMKKSKHGESHVMGQATQRPQISINDEHSIYIFHLSGQFMKDNNQTCLTCVPIGARLHHPKISRGCWSKAHFQDTFDGAAQLLML